MKVCTTCNKEKPLDEFYMDNSKSDRKKPQCKECVLDCNHSKQWCRKHRRYEPRKDFLPGRRSCINSDPVEDTDYSMLSKPWVKA